MGRAGPLQLRAVAVLLVCATAACRAERPKPVAEPAIRPSPAATPTAAPPTATSVALAPRELARSLEPQDPDALATGLIDAERRLRGEDLPPADLQRIARVHQAAYRKLAVTPKWRAVAVERAPAELAGAVADTAEAVGELRALTRPKDVLPPWRIVAPPPREELLSHYREAEAQFGVSWTVLAAIHLVETRMGRIRGTSDAGARGPMQFLPSTWAQYGKGDIESARDSILAAGRYLAAHGAPANLDRALYAYNHSNRYVRAVRLYAGVMAQDRRAYRAFHAWEVYYRTTAGDALLEVGYSG